MSYNKKIMKVYIIDPSICNDDYMQECVNKYLQIAQLVEAYNNLLNKI